MRKKVAGIILGVYILGGIIAMFGYYKHSTSQTRENIQKRIVQMQLNVKSGEDWLERLPHLFREFPAAAAVLVLNQKTRLLGSLYEPVRIQKTEFEEIRKTYKTTELKKYDYQRILTSSGISIWIISHKSISVSDFFQSLFNDNTQFIIIPVTYFLILIVLIMLLLFDFPEALKNTLPKPELSTQNLTDHEKIHGHATQPPTEREMTKTDGFLANKMLLLMDTIEKNFSTEKISFYSRESGQWIHVLEKSGNLVVRGDAGIEHVPAEISGLSDQNWREPLLSADRRVLFVPLHYRNNLFGLLRLVFSGLSHHLTKEYLDRLINLCSRYSHTVFVQRIYDKAVTDPETDFFSYPYFYFMIKEKIGASRNFAVVVFEISDINRISPEKTRFWALNMTQELMLAGLKPAVSARLERARFALLYELDGKHPETRELDRLNLIPEIIKNCTQKHFDAKARLTGGFFVRPTDFEDADAFMKRLDYLIINSTFTAYASDFQNHMTISNAKSA